MEQGIEHISTVETAKLIRKALKDAFPGLDGRFFGVISKRSGSIEISWYDGPTSKEVSVVIKRFEGTSGGYEGFQPVSGVHPDSGEEVHFGTTHVSTRRRYTVSFAEPIAELLCNELDAEVLRMEDGEFGLNFPEYSAATYSYYGMPPEQTIVRILEHVMSTTSAYVNPDSNLDGPIITPVPVIEPEPEPQPRIKDTVVGKALFLPVKSPYRDDVEIAHSLLEAKAIIKYLSDILEFVGKHEYDGSEVLGALMAHYLTPEAKRYQMGVLISQWQRHDGRDIAEVFAAALEDANYHGESAEVIAWAEFGGYGIANAARDARLDDFTNPWRLKALRAIVNNAGSYSMKVFEPEQ